MSDPARRIVRTASAALLALGLALPAAAEEVTVTVGHNRIEPARVSIRAGDTVRFHNVDEMPGGHTIAAQDGSFESPALARDESWSRTFEEPGTYPIQIRQHPKATGEIVVE